MDHIGFVGWIVSYRVDCFAVSDRIVWIGLYRIVSSGSGNTGFCALASYCLDGMDGTDGLDGALVGQGWYRRTLAPAGTGAPQWAPEQERHRWILRGGDALAGYCMDGMNGKDGTDGTDGMDGALVGRGWDGWTLAGARTGAPPWTSEQELHRWILRGDGLYEVVAGTNCVGAARTQSICVVEAK